MRRTLIIIGVLVVVGAILSFGLGMRFAQKDLHISVAAEPVTCLFGERASEKVCASGFPVTNSLILTILVDLALVLIAFYGVSRMQFIPRGFQNVVEWVVELFYNFTKSVDAKNANKFFAFCFGSLLFIVLANLFGLVPLVGSVGLCVPKGEEHAAVALVHPPGAPVADIALAEGEQTAAPGFFDSWPLACQKGSLLVPFLRAPSADLNVTIAWGLVSVVLIQIFGFQALGLSYLTKFFNFREGFMGAFVGILEFISEFVRIVAFAFRLFGNIFAGEVILVVMSFLFLWALPMPFYAFEVFVALIQAFIFAVLSLVFMSLATEAHGGHSEHDHGHPAEAH